MHLHNTRLTITINTTYPYERATVPHVPYLDLNTDQKDQRMTKISFNLRQPMLIYAIDACASGFLYKMLYLKQMHSNSLMKLDKKKGYLSMMV